MAEGKCQNRVLLFIPYFGKLPATFGLWLSSCRNNYKYSWVLFTDDHTEYDYPQNVQVVYTTLHKIKLMFEKKLGFPVALEKPYKLCDFRPLYGYLFSQYLEGYSHWGYCDLDMLFGDLNSFITEEMLRVYSKINVLGHLSILKHCKSVDMAYENCDYKTILQTSSNRTFDEIRFSPNINNVLEKNGERIKKTIPYADIGSIHYCFYLYEYNGTNKTVRANYPGSIIKYYNGKLFQLWLEKGVEQQRELAYVHFQKRLLSVDSNIDNNYYYIIPNQIVSTGQKEEELIKNHTGDDLRYTVNKMINKVKRKIFT